MLFAMLVLIGCGMGALVWLPWAAHEATEAARAGSRAGDGIDKIRVH